MCFTSPVLLWFLEAHAKESITVMKWIIMQHASTLNCKWGNFCLRLQLRCWEPPGAPKCPPDPPGQVFDNVSVNTDINYLCPRPGPPRQKTSVSYLAGNWNQQKWLMVPPEWVARKSGIRFQNAAKTRIFHHNWQPPQKCHSRSSQKVSRAAALRPVAAVTFLLWDGDIINSTFYGTFKITISKKW